MIARLLGAGPCVLATGGGAFMREETRDAHPRHGVSIWLKADADVIMRASSAAPIARCCRPPTPPRPSRG